MTVQKQKIWVNENWIENKKIEWILEKRKECKKEGKWSLKTRDKKENVKEN